MISRKCQKLWQKTEIELHHMIRSMNWETIGLEIVVKYSLEFDLILLF